MKKNIVVIKEVILFKTKTEVKEIDLCNRNKK